MVLIRIALNGQSEEVRLEETGKIVANSGGRVLMPLVMLFSPSFKRATICNQISSALSFQLDTAPQDVRMGLHLADAIVQGSDLRGDGVKIAPQDKLTFAASTNFPIRWYVLWY